MVTITFTKQERKALRKGSTLLFVSMPPPGTPGLWVGLGILVPRALFLYYINIRILSW